MRTFRKGEIFWIETGKTYSIAKKVRPGVIVSKDELNDHLPTVEIVYLTTHPKGESECHCVVGGAEKPSVALCENVLTVHNSQVGDYSTSEWNELVDAIINLPSAEKRGRWEDKEDPYGFFDTIPVCSECGHTTTMREKYNYCPNCGAKMEESE